MAEDTTGLAHVATVSFLGSRAAPSAPFWLALPGGVALARAAARRGIRAGYGASAAALLQTVAVMGPARINNPLTQAMTAPLLGRLHARGRPAWLQMLACGAIRLAHYTVLSALYIWVVLGGLDAYAGSYRTLTGWLGVLPQSDEAALALAVAGNVVWAAIYSTIQVLVYRRALRAWPAASAAGVASPAGDSAWQATGRFDPRAVALAAALATVLLLSGTAWPLLLGVAAWLAAAWAFSRADAGARGDERRAAGRPRPRRGAAPRRARRAPRRGGDVAARRRGPRGAARGVPPRPSPPAPGPRRAGGIRDARRPRPRPSPGRRRPCARRDAQPRREAAGPGGRRGHRVDRR
jgi:hypothetical protein